MQAATRSLQDVLHADRRFVIPVYQRPYVWDRERQWEPLWSDVEATAIRLAETRVAAHQRGKQASDADKLAAPHFLGAVVVEQHPTATGDIDVRSVVDGQQRLTTLQLLLRGALDALASEGVEGPLAAKVRKLIRNDEDVVSGDALFKVWPRPGEQPLFLPAMAAELAEDVDTTFAAARRFFADVALSFLRDPSIPEDPYSDGSPTEKRAALLVATLLGLVKLVVIDLDDVDDAQVIFEALNARNTPLSATDLVKNLLFMRAQAQHHDAQSLYDEIWSRFDEESEWWRASVGVGHAQRARQDWLLGDWLIAQLGRQINVGRLYGEFRRWLDDSGVTPVEALKTLEGYANAYESLHGRRDGVSPVEVQAFQRIERLNITVATPVLLWLLVQPEEHLARAERELAFRAIEAYVVRRMALKEQTRGYGQVFAEVLKAAQAAETKPGLAVIEALRRGPHGYGWPSSNDLAEQFRTGRYYGPGGINQDRLRLILGAVDSRLQDLAHKGEPVTIAYDDLQVEHVIPREWRQYWPIEAGDENERLVKEQRRESHIHRMGNLTLASDRLNPSMGNDPWTLKRDQLRQHSKLRLNALLCDHDHWDEARIEERGSWLASQLDLIWPDAEAPVWTE